MIPHFTVREGILCELKHLSSGGKEIKLEIPVVVASEPGTAQTPHLWGVVGPSITDCATVGERPGTDGHRR